MVELRLALTDEQRRQPDDDGPDRDVDEEDPGPVDRAGEDAAEQHAGRAAAPGDRSPDAEREVAVLAFLEGRGQDRERRGREEAAAEPLQRAERDQRSFGPGQSREQRADG